MYHSTTGHSVVITDRIVISIAGQTNEYNVGDPIKPEVEEVANNKRTTC